MRRKKINTRRHAQAEIKLLTANTTFLWLVPNPTRDYFCGETRVAHPLCQATRRIDVPLPSTMAGNQARLPSTTFPVTVANISGWFCASVHDFKMQRIRL